MGRRGWITVGILLAASGCGNATVSPGDGPATAGAFDAGGQTQAAPSSAAGNARGRSDAASDAPVESAADALPAAATWTAIYQNLLVNMSYGSNCTGSACHDPGTQHGIDLSSQAQGYTTMRRELTPGSPNTSALISVLQSGAMPRGRPQMPAADVDLIRAWIQAGAPND